MTESLPSGVLKVAEAKRLADEAKTWIAQVAVAAHQRSPARIKVAVEALEAFIDQLAALASPPPQATGALSDTQVIAMNPYLNDEGRQALWLAAFRFAERHHGITAASQVEPEEKQ